MIPSAAHAGCLIYPTPIVARDRLLKLGIPYELLVEAAQQGFIERHNASRFDPVTKKGTDAWSYPVRTIREGLDGLGWRIDDPTSLPLSISDELGISVTISSGDDMTGIAGGARDPKTKNPKGALIEAAIQRNVDQDDLFFSELPEQVQKYKKTLIYPVWIFLVHITDDRIRAELSLPKSMDGGDYIDGWSERIVIDVPLPGEEKAAVPDRGAPPNIVPKVTSKI